MVDGHGEMFLMKLTEQGSWTGTLREFICIAVLQQHRQHKSPIAMQILNTSAMSTHEQICIAGAQ